MNLKLDILSLIYKFRKMKFQKLMSPTKTNNIESQKRKVIIAPAMKNNNRTPEETTKSENDGKITTEKSSLALKNDDSSSKIIDNEDTDKVFKPMETFKSKKI